MDTITISSDLRNRVFESWRLGHGAPPERSAAPLLAPVRQAAADAVDYLHTRAAALRNHLIQSAGHMYVLAGAPGEALSVCSVAPPSADVPGAAPAVERIAELPQLGSGGDDASTRPAEAALDASLAALPSPNGSAPQRLLVSEGRGDLRLVDLTAGAAAVSTPLFPLRPPTPLTGVRPFVLLEAWAAAGDASLAHCLVWSVKEGPRGGPRGRHCELWTFLLRLPPADAAGTAPLALLAAQRLAATTDVPLAAAADLGVAGGALLIAAAPAPEDEDVDEVIYGHGCGPGEQQQQQQYAGLGGGGGSGTSSGAAAGAAAASAPSAGAEIPDLRGFGGRRGGSRPGGANGANGDGMEGDDDDDIDPRTLAAAAARLAHLTGDTPLGAVPQQRWTDVFKETGPDGLGATGGEPSCDISLWVQAAAAEGTETGQNQSGWRRAATVAGGAHQLLAAQSSARGAGLLLGFTDDVDCAVFDIKAAGGSVAAAEGSGGMAVDGAGAAGPSIAAVQVGCVPALAYVAAGKTQRRHTLVAEPGGPVSAAIVEGSRYAYVYGAVASDQRHGLQRLVDLELPRGDRVLGAALAQAPCAPAGGAGGRGSVQLLVLTGSEVLAFRLA